MVPLLSETRRWSPNDTVAIIPRCSMLFLEHVTVAQRTAASSCDAPRNASMQPIWSSCAVRISTVVLGVSRFEEYCEHPQGQEIRGFMLEHLCCSDPSGPRQHRTRIVVPLRVQERCCSGASRVLLSTWDVPPYTNSP